MMINLQVIKFCSVRLTKKHFPNFLRLFPSVSVRMTSGSIKNDGDNGKIVATPEKENSKTIPQYHLSYVDKLTLRYFGNVKGEIPSEVSFATMEKAESKRRIITNLFLVAFCAFGSMFAVYNVKKNLKNKTADNVYVKNSKRYQKDSEEH